MVEGLADFGLSIYIFSFRFAQYGFGGLWLLWLYLVYGYFGQLRSIPQAVLRWIVVLRFFDPNFSVLSSILALPWRVMRQWQLVFTQCWIPL